MYLNLRANNNISRPCIQLSVGLHVNDPKFELIALKLALRFHVVIMDPFMATNKSALTAR